MLIMNLKATVLMPENTGQHLTELEYAELKDPSESLSPAPGPHTPGVLEHSTCITISDPYTWTENGFRLPDKHLNLWTS